MYENSNSFLNRKIIMDRCLASNNIIILIHHFLLEVFFLILLLSKKIRAEKFKYSTIYLFFV